ncbi:MAG: ABC transporter permease [Thermomicrobiales bacterium]|nr:ABC transporter permease [Thermomicrobiales bacterium]
MTSAASSTAPEWGEDRLPPRQRAWSAIRGAAPIFLVLLALLVAIAIRNPNFTEPSVFLAFLKRATPLAILAAGQLFVVVAGEIDLSVGSLITAVVVAAAGLIDGDPAKTWPVIALLFLGGAVVGSINGSITTRLGVPSFITTLGMLLVLQGGALLATGGSPRGSLPDNFRVFGRRGFEGVPAIGQLPYSVVILVVVGALAVALLHRTTFGKQLFAAGGNPRAATLSGVDVPRVRTFAFMLSAISAVVAGILLGGFAGLSQNAGEGAEFQAISAVVLGGASLSGGRGGTIAAMAGALTLEALFTLLNLLGLPKPLRDAVQGAIIIAAVAFAAYRSRQR